MPSIRNTYIYFVKITFVIIDSHDELVGPYGMHVSNICRHVSNENLYLL